MYPFSTPLAKWTKTKKLQFFSKKLLQFIIFLVNCDVLDKNMKIYILLVSHNQSLTKFIRGTYSRHIEPIVDMRDNNDKLKSCFGIFLEQSCSWPNFFSKHSSVGGWWLPSSKNLVIHTSIQKPVNWFVCFIKSIGWSLCGIIFPMYLWCATHTHVVNLHSFYSSIPLFVLSYSLKNLGGPFSATNNHFTSPSSFFCIRAFPHQRFGNIWFNVWAISPCRQ